MDISKSRERELLDSGLTILDLFEQSEAELVPNLETVTWNEERDDVKTAAKYFIIPRIALAIPVCPDSHGLLCEYLVRNKDFSGSQDLADYPQISEHHLHTCFPSFEILPYSTTVRYTVPVWAMNERAKERAAKARAAEKCARFIKAQPVFLEVEI